MGQMRWLTTDQTKQRVDEVRKCKQRGKGKEYTQANEINEIMT